MIPWRIAIFGLLALVLLGGLAWFERSRPSSRTIALVAALAALAVAGRLAFAALPNVQATTDVVLITGFSVGAAPGFAVGALGALISNFWLAQGPWTPWEMVGWGLVGLGGAGLAALTGRRLGRFGLALACGLAGLAYGALLDYSVLATSGGAQTLDRYLAIAARGAPFNVAHAVGNAVLALAAGPALVRIIARYRDRAEFTWRREWAAPLLAFAVAAGAIGLSPGRAAAGGGSPAAYLAKARNHDGGFGVSSGSASNPEMTGWAMLGLEAAGRNPLDLGRRESTPVAYLRKHLDSVSSTGDLERTILALHGAGVNARSFGGRDLVAQLHNRRRTDGSYGGQVNLTAFGILALRATGRPIPALHRSRRWLQRARSHDGGWGFQPGVASDPDSTGAALQGLAAASAGSRALRRGVRYLSRSQNHDGGWPLAGRGPSNSQSTAWAVQGLIAAGKDPAATRAGGHGGLDYLASRRASNGRYRYSRSSDQTPVWVTGQALMAVERKALPLAAVARSPSSGGSGTDTTPSSGGSGGTAPTTTVPPATPVAPPSSTGGVPPIVNSANAAPPLSAREGAKMLKGKNSKSRVSPNVAPSSSAELGPGARAKGLVAPAPLHAGQASAPVAAEKGGDGGDGGTPAWVYAAVAAAAAALLGGAGVWWYRSGGWVPPRPQMPRLR